MARPTLFKQSYVEQARKLAQLGATDREIASFFEVTEQTINNWKLSHPEFFESLKVGKEMADERVVQSLYRRALGYSYDAVKIFMPAGKDEPVYAPYVEHNPPDTSAMIFWLKNRRSSEWRQGGTCHGASLQCRDRPDDRSYVHRSRSGLASRSA